MKYFAITTDGKEESFFETSKNPSHYLIDNYFNMSRSWLYCLSDEIENNSTPFGLFNKETQKFICGVFPSKNNKTLLSRWSDSQQIEPEDLTIKFVK